MAVASSSSSPREKYDVFLSFRGEDTRYNFTSHMYAALCQKKINTFIDDEELKRGDQISSSLLNAIEQSKISLIIFSKEYASSRWCLEELVKILECKDKYGQIVIPVFYNIDPSDVRNQYGTFRDAFAKHEERFKGRQEMLLRWRTALREAANLSGFDSNVIRSESILVQKVVEKILEKLNEESPLIENKNLVGLDSRIEYIEWLLCIGFAGVRKIGIWGIGGIGKTALADAVFNKISGHFESSYFIKNIREESEKSHGLADLHQKLICAILKDEHANIGSTFTKRRLANKKILIVFDDVIDLQQIESLIGHFEYLGSGSRFMITTRDKQVLKNCEVDHIYETEILSDDVALQLFSRYAFRQNLPTKDFMQLSKMVLSYAKGVPLALKVLGSSLFERTKKEWESYIKRLSRIPNTNIQKVLKVSYDGLNIEERHVFLDIACFFKGYNRDLIEAILDGCGFDSHIDINVLIERSLITTSSNTITMHDLLQEMGKDIVRQESTNDPGKRSRLWDHEDIISVLTNNAGTRAILGMRLDMSKVRQLHLNPKAFKKMHNLRFLEVYDWRHDNKVHGFEIIKSDFSELRYLCWDGYSANSLPRNFNPKNLVALDMQSSKLEQLWNGDQKQDLVNLKHIDLSYSKHLCRMPDLSRIPNLESLILKGCTNLRESFSSIHNLNKLVLLNLQECKTFNRLSFGTHWKSLRKLILSNCSDLKTVSFIPCTVESLYLDGTLIKELPSLKHLSRLETLNVKRCSRLESLPESISELKSLETVICSYSSSLKTVPYVPCTVELLCLDGTAIRELPSLRHLYRLKELYLQSCSRIESLPISICELKSLRHLNLSDCSNLKMVPYIPCTVEALYLDGTAIKELPSVEHLFRLETLSLKNCSRLESLPENFCELKCLRFLFLSDCSNLKMVPYIPCTVEKLYLDGTAIKELPSLEHLFRLETLSLKKCSRLESLQENICELKSLRFLYVSDCSKLDRLPNSLGNLKALWILEVEGIAIREVPSSITCLQDLSILSFASCRIQEASFLVFASSWLESLDLTDCCIEVLPKDLGRICSLKCLYLGRNNFESLPVSIKYLSNLFWLDLHNCEKLKSLPELPQQLQRVEAQGCTSLEASSSFPSLCPIMHNWFVKISLINCSKLKLHALPDLTNVVLNIQRNTSSRFRPKKVEGRRLGPPAWPRAFICYPGSKIPEWFSFKSTGFEIKLPAGWLNDDLFGFILCAVASFRDYQELGTFKVRFLLLVNKEVVFSGVLFDYNGNEVIESDHVFVGYDYEIESIELLTLSLNSEGYIVFFVEHGSEKSIDFSKVKKCGVRLLYAKDNYMGSDAKVDRDQRLIPIN